MEVGVGSGVEVAVAVGVAVGVGVGCDTDATTRASIVMEVVGERKLRRHSIAIPTSTVVELTVFESPPALPFDATVKYVIASYPNGSVTPRMENSPVTPALWTPTVLVSAR